MRTARSVLIEIVSLVLVSQVWAADPIEFKNTFEEAVYLTIVTGNGDSCEEGGVIGRYLIPPDDTLVLASKVGASCYYYSFFDDPAVPPLGAGTIKNNAVDLDGSTIAQDSMEISISSDPELAGSVDWNEFGAGALDFSSAREVEPSSQNPMETVGLMEAGGTKRVEKVLATWDDPLTLPKTKMSCTKMASGRIPFDGKWKTCVGWKLQCKKMRRQLVAVATGPSIQTLKSAIENCAKTAAFAGGIAAIVSGGSAAVVAAEATMKVCLSAKVPDLIGFEIKNRGGWTNWRGC